MLKDLSMMRRRISTLSDATRYYRTRMTGCVVNPCPCSCNNGAQAHNEDVLGLRTRAIAIGVRSAGSRRCSLTLGGALGPVEL